MPVLALTPELILLVGAVALLMRGAFSSSETTDVAPAVLLFLVAAIAVLTLIGDRPQGLFDNAFIADAHARFFKTLILLAGAASLWIARLYEHDRLVKYEYPVLMSLAVIGMTVMVSAGDLMTLYVGLELQGGALYILAAWDRDNLRSTEAGLKYFVLGALASGLLLYGISLLYGATGSMSLAALTVAPGDSDAPLALIFGLAFFLAGMAFKLSAAPFHMWTPDVYEGAPTPVVAFFAAAPKLAAIAVLCRAITPALAMPHGDALIAIPVAVALLSMIVGALGALAQTNIKRLMAYSAVGHMGYVALGIAASGQVGVFSVLFYAAVYATTALGAFAFIAAMRRKGKPCERLADLSGLAQTHPLAALMMMIILLSIAGIPPLAGFFAKYYVFLAAVEAGLIFPVLIGVATSVVACFYSLWIIKIMYMDDRGVVLDPFPAGLTTIAAIVGVGVGVFAVFPGPALVAEAQAVALSLMSGSGG